MDNISKVRTLVDIARQALAYHINEAEQRHEKERLIRPDRDIIARIDAALAEPVEPVHPSSLTDVVTLLENERDEARAEVERLNRTLNQVFAWTRTYGDALVPPPGCADSFGDGMRQAKGAVAGIILRGGEDK